MLNESRLVLPDVRRGRGGGGGGVAFRPPPLKTVILQYHQCCSAKAHQLAKFRLNDSETMPHE